MDSRKPIGKASAMSENTLTDSSGILNSFREGKAKTKSNAIEIPSISLPKGGGAIKGIDEKFTVNAVNGTASFSIPLPFSQARGVTPSLSVSYNSGSDNGIFGLGWNLNLSSIKRKTDKLLPQYLDSINGSADSDIFQFSEAEDLVPEFSKADDGTFLKDEKDDYIIYEKNSEDDLYVIRFFRPRIEGLFARIERWTKKDGSDIKWRVITSDNITTLFGWSINSRIADPQDDKKIFEWLPEFTFDDKGNCCNYIYKSEDLEGIDLNLIHNKNRIKNNSITYTNLYIEKVLYGNITPYKNFGDAFPSNEDFLFKTVFDYGTTINNENPETFHPWDFRNDAFSEYKSGFEIRTTRLCKRVLLFHHFKGENEYDGLVRSLNFEYDTSTEQDFTFLKSITSIGYIKKADGSYSSKKLPPFEFEYQKHVWNNEIKSIPPEALMHAPSGIEESPYQFVDLFNEGLSGILSEQETGWYYKHNLGDGNFEPAKLVSPKPSFAGLGSHLQLADLDADGGKQLVSYINEPKGYFELNDDNEWQLYQNFKTLPNINFNDPFTRMIDLNGDGKPELVISEDNVFTWYESEGRNGFKDARKTTKPSDEEIGPHLIFADLKQIIFLADMSGDGLTDIIRIRNGEICYWPNLGYGKFGAKVAMDNAPVFDHEDIFNPSFIKLADIDGSGIPDIIYLGKNKFSCYKNLSGNSFSIKPFEIPFFPEIHSLSNFNVTDFLGTGVACIIWSSPLAKDATTPLKYIDLMNSKKPHVMVSYKNNMGKEVSLEYSPSTKFYIEDKLAGKPWVTKLHFPVHCVSKATSEDKITGHKFSSNYKYHHGYYDHFEREFRGFGMVEQTDAETFEHWVKSGATNITVADLHQEPVITKQWFHTGSFLRKDKILSHFEHEYWYEEMGRQGFTAVNHEKKLDDAFIIPSKGIPQSVIDNLSSEEYQEALRACKGMPLRSEVFAHDAIKFGNTPNARKKELTPFSVDTHNCVIELLQPKGKNRYAVFIVKESEAINYSYERNTEDPRIGHTLNIKLDEYANVLESVSVVYPRRIENISLPIEIQDAQNKLAITFTKNEFTNDAFDNNANRMRLLAEVKTYELKGVIKTGDYYSLKDFQNILDDVNSSQALYHELDKPLDTNKAQRRLIEHVKTLFYRNDLTGPLSLKTLETKAIGFESYQLAYTPQLLNDIFGAKVNDALIELEGKFRHSIDELGNPDSDWWVRSGTTQFIEGTETLTDAQNRFYVPLSYTDPFGSKTKVKYYRSYFLFLEETEDVLGNKTKVSEFNFRTLSLNRMMDINGNLSEVLTDELGLVKAMAIMGKGSQADDLSNLKEETDVTENAAVFSFFNLPETPHGVTDSITLINIGRQLLQNATARFVYDFDAYKNTGKPVVVASILRETHFRNEDGDLNPETRLQISFEYSSGAGQVTMKKVQAEPGLAKRVRVQLNNSVLVEEVDTGTLLRWIGNGKTIVNNKGNVVKQYEPYFSVSNNYEDYKELVQTGVSSLMFYDAIGRLIRTDMPDGTFFSVTFDSWKQVMFDANDNVLESDWYKRRTNNTRADFITDIKEQEAAAKTSLHADTPGQMHLDTLSRPVLSIAHNKNTITNTDEYYNTFAELDVEGNLRSVKDARGNVVMAYKYDMLGNLVYQSGMDNGQRWLLTNVIGNPLRTWDERFHEFQYFYDEAHRPTHSKVLGGDGTPLNHIFDRIIYGESLLTSIRTDSNRFNEGALQKDNVLGQVIKHYDTGGLIDTPLFDFKGQPKSTSRRIFIKYKETANWIDANLSIDLESDTYTFITQTDALGRIVHQTTPDGSVITPLYNEAGLLDSEAVLHPGAILAKSYIKTINYNEKGQRERIIYGNDVITHFTYDKDTLRLKRLVSRRQNNGLLQDLQYTFDATGNITHIHDNAIPTVFFDNMQINAVSEYTYDAFYRLVEASGRENNAALNFSICDNWNDKPFLHNMNLGNPMAVRHYTQRYQYDAVGNIVEMKHLATGGNWTRGYEYETSNNRLKRTFIGDNGNPIDYTNYAHHAKHGYLEKLPHLEKIGWNFKEEVVLTSRQHCTGDNIPVITYYQYDGSGQRIRKITENQANSGVSTSKKEERIYIGGYEIYKKHSGAQAGLERVSLSLMDGDHRFVMIETRNDVDDGTEKQLVRYQLHNHLGSSSLELDNSAQVISYEEYHPYGTTAYQANNATIKSTAKRYRYTGMERDEETGLEYHSARYYLPWLGRWLSCDPIGVKGGINLFTYCNNNPIIRTDAKGTEWELTWKFWQWEPINFTKEEIVPTAKVFSGNVVGTVHAIFGYDTDRELDPDQAAGYEWAQDTFRWQRFKPVQKLRDKIINSPTASKIVANVLGFMSAFVPFAPSGDDLPESMQYDYKRMSFAASSTAMLMGLAKPSKGQNFSPPPSPALVTDTGALVTTVSSSSVTTGMGPFAMAMAASKDASSKGSAQSPQKTSKKVTHKGVATDILKANKENRSNQTILTAKIKLKNGQEIKVAIPNTPFNGETPWRAGQREAALKAGYTPLETTKNSVPGMHAEENLGAYIKEQGGGLVLEWAIARGDNGTSFICKSATCRVMTAEWGPQEFK
ncbi:hypothetical protein MYP_2891 [Sporocytophaga myxococcoides]|uniref:Insecticidal toxin complex protein n=1 Tax=Sporocytophaga myxococcoides TaxID=153721 RepID=A0A098LGS0_9BACT|nr:SpvB/TcaC N-terminal domain-containing protein [Sporocytophaga myxococcoides]GAL85662.1 hypothetical protein MYP_2891 [Sporocytophaga myxococcoides]